MSFLSRLGWLSEFAWEENSVVIRKTGIRLPVDGHLIAEVATWIPYLLLLAGAALVARARRGRRLSIFFTPDVPRPWYLVRGAALWAGIRVTRTHAAADAAFYFDDVTVADPPPAQLPGWNFSCTNIAKSHVAEVFAEVFGYPLRVDPWVAAGLIVEKSEKNGVHDGRIVEAPLEPRAGYVYQRLVDTADNAGLSYDLRTPCVRGVPVLVWVKVKPAAARFAIHNRVALLREPEDMFSAGELAKIHEFSVRMGADWAGLDILRDRHDGRIYIVDVNKTDLGPLIALSWADKIRSMRRLGKALEQLVAAR